MRLASRLLCAALSVSILAASAPSFADPTAEELAAARQLGTEGYELAEAGKCNEAIPKLQKAADLFPAPTIVGRLGECLVEIGKLVVGTEMLQKVVTQDLGAKPNPAFVDAQKRAQAVLDKARPKIAKLTIKVTGAPIESVKVTVDDAVVPPKLLELPRPTDPGSRTVTASATGYVTATQAVTLTEGGASEVTLELKPEATTTVTPKETPKVVPKETPLPPPQPDVSKGPSTLTWVAFGVGGVGLIAGGVFGAVAVSKKGKLDDACKTPSTCPRSSDSDISSMKTMANLSTVGFVIGAIGVGAGAVLLFTSKKSDTVARGPSASAYVGLGTVGLTGEF